MAADPLEIIRQDANATAQFFGAVNSTIAQAAANEINVAKAASSIVDTTFRAREAKRVNDQQIRSSIIRDEIAQRNSQMQEAVFQQEMQMAPMKMRIQELQLQREQALLKQAQEQEYKANFDAFINTVNPNLSNDAFASLYSTNDPGLLQAYADIKSKALQGIYSGKFDETTAAQYVESEYNKFKEGYIPESKEYNPATTTLIARTIGEDAAAAYDLEYNPNKSALKLSQRAALIQGTREDHEKLIKSTTNPEERAKMERALSEYKAAEAQAENGARLLKKYVDDWGNIRTGTDSSVVIPTSEEGVSVPYNTVAREDRERFIRSLQAQINQAVSRQQQILNAVQTGGDIPDFRAPVPELDDFDRPVSGGATGQQEIIGLTTVKATPEQIEAARTNNAIDQGEFKSQEDAFRRLSSVARTDKETKMEANLESIRDRHGLTKTLKGVKIDGANEFNYSDLAAQIKSNLDSLSEKEIAKTFFSEGQIVDKIASRVKIPARFTTPSEGVFQMDQGYSNDEQIKRLKLLKRFARQNKLGDDESVEDLKLAFAEALAAEIVNVK